MQAMDDTFEHKGTTFVWDRAKARANAVKHGVMFEQAVEAFFDPFLCLDDASRNDEERNAVIGRDQIGRVLYVVHVLIEDTAIRLVSARKATRQEQKTYDS